MSDISSTFGAMLLGGLVAVGLSGVLGVQTFVYLKLYSNDSARTKILVRLAIHIYLHPTYCILGRINLVCFWALALDAS